MNRHERIARDLEKLPPELHEPVLADLRVIDVLDLAAHAGASLLESIQVSKTWRPLWGYHNYGLPELRTLPQGVGFQEMCTLAQGAWKVLCKHPWLRQQFLAHECRTKAWSHPEPADRSYTSYFISLWFLKYGDQYRKILRVSAAQFNDLCKRRRAPFVQLDQDIRHFVAENLGSLMGPFREHAFFKYYELTASAPWPESAPPRHDTEWEAWTVEQLEAYADHYFGAQRHWNERKYEQLLELARLYERFPAYVKAVLAPQEPRKNTRHTPKQIRCRAKKMRYTSNLLSRGAHGDHAFRYVHPYLVPYDWTLRLWSRAAERYPDKVDAIPKAQDAPSPSPSTGMTGVPPEIREAMSTARLGMCWYFTDCSQCVETAPPGKVFPRCKQCSLFTPFKNLSRLTQKDQVPEFAASAYPAMGRVARVAKRKCTPGSQPQLSNNKRRVEGRKVSRRKRRAEVEKTLGRKLTPQEFKDGEKEQLRQDQDKAGTVGGVYAPTDEREIQWLKAYLTVIDWMHKDLGVSLDDDDVKEGTRDEDTEMPSA